MLGVFSAWVDASAPLPAYGSVWMDVFLQVRSAVATGNYAKYFKLYTTVLNMGNFVMDFVNSDIRIKALTTMAKA